MKTISFTITSILAFSLVGCGGDSAKMNEESTPSSQPVPTSSPVNLETSVAEPDESSTTITLIPSMILSSGEFAGAGGHKTSGSVRVFDTEGKITVQLGEDFSLDGAPAPYVALGNDGYKVETNMGKLKVDQGASTYDLPGGIDVTKYNEVIIWCEDFSVPIGVAKLKRTE